jgi:hypothetical protein
MMGKRDGAKDHEHQGRTRTLEGNKEISHRPWYRRIRTSRIGTEKGVAEKMSKDEYRAQKIVELKEILSKPVKASGVARKIVEEYVKETGQAIEE